MRKADVCVTTEGIDGSNGWKLAEYVAASKPIVSEPLRYGLPGDFRSGQNFLAFTTSADCVTCVQRYLAEPQLATMAAVANYDYYHTWVRPDVLIRHTIFQALRRSDTTSVV